MANKALGKEKPVHKQLLFDSDFFVGWVFAADTHHRTVERLLQSVQEQNLHPLTTNWVLLETATVLSHRKNQQLAIDFLDHIERINFPVVTITEALQEKALLLFRSQTRKGTSTTDCGNVAVMRELGIEHIASFDKAYSKQFGVQLFG